MLHFRKEIVNGLVNVTRHRALYYSLTSLTEDTWDISPRSFVASGANNVNNLSLHKYRYDNGSRCWEYDTIRVSQEKYIHEMQQGEMYKTHTTVEQDVNYYRADPAPIVSSCLIAREDKNEETITK